MAKADVETKDGTKITIEGTPEEVSKIINLYREGNLFKHQKELKKFVKHKGSSKPTLTDKVRELIAEGFFDKPKGLANLKQGLEEQGCFVPITTLSAIVLSLVKQKELRRIKQQKKWAYAKR
jgi:hypothetical protein